MCWFKSSRPQPHKTPLGKKLPDGVLLCPDRQIASVTMLLTMFVKSVLARKRWESGDEPMLGMPSCSLPDLEEEVPVVMDSIGLSPYVLDEAVGAFERPVGHVVQHPVPDSVPMAFEEPAEPVELFAAGGLGHRKPSAPVQRVLLLDFVLIVSVISVVQMPETGSLPLDYHIQTTGRLLRQFDLIIPSSLKKVQPTDSPPVCRLGFKFFLKRYIRKA